MVNRLKYCLKNVQFVCFLSLFFYFHHHDWTFGTHALLPESYFHLLSHDQFHFHKLILSFQQKQALQKPFNPIHFDCVSAPGALEILTACFCSLTAGQLYSDLIISVPREKLYILTRADICPLVMEKMCLVVHWLKRSLHSHNTFQIRASVKN